MEKIYIGYLIGVATGLIWIMPAYYRGKTKAFKEALEIAERKKLE